MTFSGIAWGLYTLEGANSRRAFYDTMKNFSVTVPFAIVLALAPVISSDFKVSGSGALLAILSGALSSGIGYACWFAALPQLKKKRVGKRASQKFLSSILQHSARTAMRVPSWPSRLQ